MDDEALEDNDDIDHVEEYVYVDTQEDLPSLKSDGSVIHDAAIVHTNDDEDEVFVNYSRRSSLYLDETDGKYGTWKLDINS